MSNDYVQGLLVGDDHNFWRVAYDTPQLECLLPGHLFLRRVGKHAEQSSLFDALNGDDVNR